MMWLRVSCAILWLVLRAVRSLWFGTGVLPMLCGLGMNALVMDTNAGSMPVIGRPSSRILRARHSTVRRFTRDCHSWQTKRGSGCLAPATSPYTQFYEWFRDLC
jgi:hypothetical protein